MAVVIPVLDEVNHLPLLLADLEAQDLPASEFDVLVLDGGSSDGTRELLDQHTPSTAHGFAVLENPGRTVPHARNLAMAHMSDDVGVVVELIGHVRISPNHLSNRKQAWQAGLARHGDDLGALGVRVLGPDRPSTVVESWVDGALRSSLGRGGGQFAHFTEVGPTKVPAFASHSRAAVEAVGGWDVAFATSQDSELAMRLRSHGYVMERDPSVEVRMSRRTNLRSHWRMAVRYGYWRGRLLRSYPSRLDPREFAPLFGAMLCMMLLMMAPMYVAIPVGAYALVLLMAGLFSSLSRGRLSHAFGVPVCLVMLHTGFTAGLLRSLVAGPPRKRDR